MTTTVQGVWAVLLPRLCMNAAVYVNGTSVGSGGRLDPPLSRNWNRPLFLPFSGHMLRQGENVVHVLLVSEPTTQANLFPILVGTEAELRPRYEWLYLVNISLNQATTLVIAAIGFLMLSLWWRRRQDAAHGYFGLAALVWAAQSTNLYVQDIALATRHWEVLAHSGMDIFGALFFLSLLRFTAIRWPLMERLLWGIIPLVPLTSWWVPEHWYQVLALGWHLVAVLLGMVVLARIGHAALRRHNAEARPLVAVFGAALLFAVHDWLMHGKSQWYQSITQWIPQDIYLTHFSAPMMFLVVGWIMTGRFARMSSRLENLNTELEQRVRVKHAELESSFARTRELEQDRATMRERERIYRDLHDDVGAKLLSLVYRAGSAENAELARSALQDLRDVVSTSAQAPVRLAYAFADWRLECEERLTAAHLELDWDDTAVPSDLLLASEKATHLVRILREAVSNVIRHAQASRVRVLVVLTGDALTMEIADDGIGQDVEKTLPGRGRQNMLLRARRLGAKISWRNGRPNGCLVIVEVPMMRPRTPPAP